MTDHTDYDSLLRSMSALSQQFSQRRPRFAGTPQNPMLNWRRSSSRVTKSRSNQSSPLTTQPRRTAQAAMLNQAYLDECSQFMGPVSDPDRPRSWHADVHLPSSDYTQSQPFTTTDSMGNAYLQSNSQAHAFTYQDAASWQAGGAWGQTQMPVLYPTYAQSSTHCDNQSFGADWAHFPVEQAPRLEPSSISSGLGLGLNDLDSHERDLVGVGLYDKSTSEDGGPSLLLGMGLGDEQPAGRGLQLEETWTPPAADQVPEAEADEGSDTPVTADFQAWAPFEHDAGLSSEIQAAPWPASAEDLVVPQIRQGDVYTPNLFFSSSSNNNDDADENDGSAIPEDMLAIQHKAVPASWYDNDWFSAHAAFGYY